MSLHKKSSLFPQPRYVLFFFAYAVLYSAVIVNHLLRWEVDEKAIYSFYCVDFSYGFATKLLPGAIFNALFGSHATRNNATLFLTVVMLLFFFGVAVLLQRFMLRVATADRTETLFLLLFFLSGPYTFAIFTKTLGLLDTFWICFSLLFFFFMEHKLLRFLIPLLFAACIFVHNASIISYIVLMGIVLLYRASIAESKEERRGFFIILILSCCTAISLFVFFALKEKSMVCSLDEFRQKLHARGCECLYYYDYAFFDLYENEKYIPDFVDTVQSPVMRAVYDIYYRIMLNINVLLARKEEHLISLLCGLLVLFPMVGFFIRFHMARFREKHNPLRRFCAFLMAVQFPFTFAAAFPLSEDITRWLTHAFLIAFTCVLTVLYYEPQQQKGFLERWKQLSGAAWMKIYFLAYATISMYTIN